jgi:hypothetical protein
MFYQKPLLLIKSKAHAFIDSIASKSINIYLAR